MKKRNFTFRYGLYIYLSIVAFFALMKVFNLEDISELRLFNFVFVIYFVNKLIVRNFIEDDKVGYLYNLRTAFGASATAVFLSCASMLVYTTFISPEFPQVLEGSFLFGRELTGMRVVLVLFLEGMASSAIVAFSLMQYWKNYKREHKNVALD